MQLSRVLSARMVAVDTNVLIRYIVQDDRHQAAAASRLIDRAAAQGMTIYVSLVTLVEIVWVLQRTYGFSREQTAATVDALLAADALMLQNEYEVHTANEIFRETSADFPDALIAAVAEWAGCSTTLTFDRKAARTPGFTAL